MTFCWCCGCCVCLHCSVFGVVCPLLLFWSSWCIWFVSLFSLSFFFIKKMYFTCRFRRLILCLCVDSGNYVKYDANPIIYKLMWSVQPSTHIQASKLTHTHAHLQIHKHISSNEKTSNYLLSDLLESGLVVKNNRSLSYLVFDISPKSERRKASIFTFTNHRLELFWFFRFSYCSSLIFFYGSVLLRFNFKIL